MKNRLHTKLTPPFAVMVMAFIAIQFFLVRFVQRPLTAFEKRLDPDLFFVDSFQYYRSWMVVVFAVIFMLWVVMELITAELSVSLSKYQKLLLFLAGVVLIASLLSPFREQVIQGAMDDYQGGGVCLSYLLIALCISWKLAADQRLRECILSGAGFYATFLLAIGSVVGIIQHYGVNIMETPFFRQLVAPSALEDVPELFLNNGMAYSFFGNPNYLGSVWMLFLPFAVHASVVKDEKKSFVYLLIAAMAYYSVFCAQSLGGVLFVPIAVLVMVWLYQRAGSIDQTRLHRLIAVLAATNVLFIIQGLAAPGLKEAAVSLIVLLAGYVALSIARIAGDRIRGRYVIAAICVGVLVFLFLLVPSGRLASKDPLLLRDVAVKPSELQIVTQSGAFSAKVADGKLVFFDSRGIAIPTRADGEHHYLMGAGYEGIHYILKSKADYDVLRIWPFNFHFAVSNKGIQFVNRSQRIDTITSYASFLPLEWDHLGTGRLYIWSEAVRLIGKAPLFGYGPGTFFISFPQNDVVGKYNAVQNADVGVDKPHNLYLQSAFEFGVPYLIGFILLNFWILKSLYLSAFRGDHQFVAYAAAITGFLLIGLVNDFKVFSASFYWVVMALAISAVAPPIREKPLKTRLR